MDESLARRLIAERKQRANGTPAQERHAIIGRIRSFFYGKQRAYYRSKAKRRATRKTRRAGATVGGCRELLARALEHRDFRATYCNETTIEARALAWESDTKSGFYDVVREYGTKVESAGVPRYQFGDVVVDVYDGEMTLSFSNGSQIDMFCADDERAMDRLRGRAKHVLWVDEAQKFRFLDKFYKAVVVGVLNDYKGECWLSGTPHEDCAGFFYDVTKEPGSEDGEPLPGWEVHALSVVDNPFFGRVERRADGWYVLGHNDESPPVEVVKAGPFELEGDAEKAAEQVRWDDTAGAAIAENKWKDDDPDLLREWFAQWVKTDARFVYHAHRLPRHRLVYAPARFGEDGNPDIALALTDLPGWTINPKTCREYILGLGADLGTTGGFAWVLGGWSMLDPVLYEVASWKRKGLDYDEMAAQLNAIRHGFYIGLVTADAGGGGKPAVMGWSKKWVERYQIPIVEASKTNKEFAIGQCNTDIVHERWRVREGGALLQEWLTHKWAPLRSATGKLVEMPGSENHVADAGLYLHRESYHHRYREIPLTPQPGSSEFLEREERELEQAACEPDDDEFYAWR